MTRQHAFFLLLVLSLLLAACGDDGSPGDGGGGDADAGEGGLGYCGDEEILGDELCDDGNNVDGDGCSANCMSFERCGNGYVDSPIGEVCDDGNSVNGDGCSADCMSDETCGNSIVDLGVGEVCDDGNTMDGDGCSADCMTGPVCGDGVANGGEVCDDGNTDSGDGCSGDCTSDETCGNSITDPGEECDDGNTTAGDGCSDTCAIERCGNGSVEGTEECDDGNAMNGDGCEDDCTFSCAMDSDCDDGMVCNGTETCDTTAHTCTAGTMASNGTSCGSGMVCRAGVCAMPVCGNSIVEGSETCDDGNSMNGDGCDNDCTYSCTMTSDCDDGMACNGAETCNTSTHVCTNPADLADGTSCGGGNVCRGGSCVAPSCGNTIVETGEDCDDGNSTNGDGCDNDCTYSCTAAADCDDGDLCNGVESCNTTTHVCAGGSSASDGTVCDRDGMTSTRDICLSMTCVASSCGDTFVDDTMGGTEDCDDGNSTNGDGCDNDCTFSCTADGDCADGNTCNGTETCNTTAHTCASGTAAADGTMCDRGMMTRDICLMASCAQSRCGDGYLDTGATPPEACDDGNLTAGDGCEPDCTVTGTGPTAFRVQTLDFMHPHIYASLPIFGCRDVTDFVPLSLAEPVNTTLQNSVDDYTLNYITVHRPLDLAMMTNPIDLVDGECMAGASSGDPDVCQVGMGTVFPYTGTNLPAGMTCFTPDPSRYNYLAPNTSSGPCFVTDVQDLSVTVSGTAIPLIDAQVTATYSGGSPPTQLVSGVITGFLTVADAMAAIIPSGALAGDSLYQHLADGGASGSSCSSNDDTVMYTPSGGGPAVNGFWFFLNFTSDQADWTGP